MTVRICRKCGIRAGGLLPSFGLPEMDQWPADDMCPKCFSEHKLEGYADLADLDEDKRIGIIGDAVTKLKKTVAVCVDSEPGKADRYIRKLMQRYPDCEVKGRFAGPVKGVTTIKVGPRLP